MFVYTLVKTLCVPPNAVQVEMPPALSSYIEVQIPPRILVYDWDS